MKLLLIASMFLSVIFVSSAFAEDTPDWVKNTAGWWATDMISETEFVNAIEFLVNEEIIEIDRKPVSKISQNVPDWVKNTAGWWATDMISETEFVNAISFLVNHGVINVDQTCIYKINYNFKNLDQKQLEQLCNNEYNLDYTKEITIKKTSEIQLNEQGFRGKTFTPEKPHNTYRIFLIGGSTIFNGDNLEDEIVSYHLQKKFDEQNIGIEVEVINAGLSGQWSKSEISLIKNNLVNFSPDLFLVFDGWNDHSRKITNKSNANENVWKNNWIELCEFGKKNEFDTIVALEPLVGISKKIMTDQEYKIYLERGPSYLGSYPPYANQLEKIAKYCTDAVDFRNIFDHAPYPIYTDEGHKNSKGNEIVANEFYKISLPLILEKHNITPDLIQIVPDTTTSIIPTNNISDNSNYSWQIISNQDFSKKNLKNANFEGSVIKNSNFSDANLEGANFRFSDIDQTNFENANMKNIDLSRAVVTRSNLMNANMEESYSFGSVFHNSVLENTNMSNMNLQGTRISSVFEKTDLSNSDFSWAKLELCDLKNSKLSNTISYYTYFLECNFSDTDLSKMNFKMGNKLAGSIFSNTILPEELHDADLTAKMGLNDRSVPGAKINNINFQGINIADVMWSNIFVENDLSESAKKGYYDFQKMNGIYVINANFSNLNLSEKNLSLTKFISSDFSSANLSNTDLRYSDLNGSNLEGANLEGANLEGANLNCINNDICKN